MAALVVTIFTMGAIMGAIVTVHIIKRENKTDKCRPGVGHDGKH